MANIKRYVYEVVVKRSETYFCGNLSVCLDQRHVPGEWCTEAEIMVCLANFVT